MDVACRDWRKRPRVGVDRRFGDGVWPLVVANRKKSVGWTLAANEFGCQPRREVKSKAGAGVNWVKTRLSRRGWGMAVDRGLV